MDTSVHSFPFPWERIAAPEPWEAAILVTGPLPADPKEVAAWSGWVTGLEALLVRMPEVKRELLLQVWKLGPKHGAEELEEHAGSWWPQLGLGVWPDREPPQSWNQELLSDAFAASLNAEEVPLPSHKLLTLKVIGDEQHRAARLLRGHGALLEMFSPQALEEMQERGRDLFLPRMVEKRFRKARFYLPLLDRRTLAAAKDAEELNQWLCGATVYLRESAEDQGVLLVAKMPLSPLLKAVEESIISDGQQTS
jgi:hypothetical protein